MKRGVLNINDFKLGTKQGVKVMRGNTLIWPDVVAALTVSPSFRQADPEGGTFSITVTSNIAWAVMSENSWMSITSGSSGNGNGTIQITATENTTSNIRIGNIRVEGGGITRYVGVNQDQNEAGIQKVLVGNYPLNETSGQAIDLANGQNGTVSGLVTRNGANYNFDGASGGRVDIIYNYHHSFVNFQGDIAFEMEFRVMTRIFTGLQWIINKRDGDGTPSEWQIIIDGNKLVFTLMDNASINFISRRAVIPAINTEYLVRLEYDGSKNRTGLKIFINGVRSDSEDGGQATYPGMTQTHANTRIGRPGFSDEFLLNGTLRDLKIWKYL